MSDFSRTGARPNDPARDWKLLAAGLGMACLILMGAMLWLAFGREPAPAAAQAAPVAAVTPPVTQPEPPAPSPSCILSVLSAEADAALSSKYSDRLDVGVLKLMVRNDGTEPIGAWEIELEIRDALGDRFGPRLSLKNTTQRIPPGGIVSASFQWKENMFISGEFADLLIGSIGAKLTPHVQSCKVAP